MLPYILAGLLVVSLLVNVGAVVYLVAARGPRAREARGEGFERVRLDLRLRPGTARAACALLRRVARAPAPRRRASPGSSAPPPAERRASGRWDAAPPPTVAVCWLCGEPKDAEDCAVCGAGVGASSALASLILERFGARVRQLSEGRA